MHSKSILQIAPVMPSSDLERDIAWYARNTGFEHVFGQEGYAVLRREESSIHLQWHADTEDDPLLGGSVIRIFVNDINPVFQACVDSGVVDSSKLRRNTPWQTHEFGMYDPNGNAIFFVEDAS